MRLCRRQWPPWKPCRTSLTWQNKDSEYKCPRSRFVALICPPGGFSSIGNLSAKGKSYIGAVLRPGDTVALEATDLVIPDNRVLRFQVFESAANTTVKMCLDSATNCPYSTSQGATRADGVWQTARVKIPAKTHTVCRYACSLGTRRCPDIFF